MPKMSDNEYFLCVGSYSSLKYKIKVFFNEAGRSLDFIAFKKQMQVMQI